MIEDFPIDTDYPEPRAAVQIVDGPRGQAIANIEHAGYGVTSGNQGTREAALAKLALMCFEMWTLNT